MNLDIQFIASCVSIISSAVTICALFIKFGAMQADIDWLKRSYEHLRNRIEETLWHTADSNG